MRLGQAVIVDLGMGRGPVPGVISKIDAETGEYLVSNVYWPVAEHKPDGFEWAGWITADELHAQQGGEGE